MMNIRAWLMLGLMIMILSCKQLLYSSQDATTPSGQAAATPSGFPFVFMTVDGHRAAATKYDYIVVGGGTAGCPLAATLAANYSVLLIERGGSPYGNPDIENADAYGKVLYETDNYTSVAQTFVSEDGVSNARARVLGGGTAINAGFYSRASREYVRNMSWDERLVNESYEWVENQTAFKPDYLSSWSSAMRAGLLEAGILPDNGYTLDHVEGTKISASTFDNNCKRHTAADFLNSTNTSNIVVLLNATVSRILFNSSAEETKDDSSQKPKASGVEFMNVDGQSYQAFLNESSRSSEVILTAGSLGSPQLLLLSGIGPSEHLKEFNIPLVLDSPSVGQRIQDNPRASVYWSSDRFYPFSNTQVVGILNHSQSYTQYSSSVNGSAYPHDPNKTNAYSQFIGEKVAVPLSRGELRLSSRDPRDNPSVRYNYYSDPQDIQECVDGVRVISNLLNTTSLRGFISWNHIDLSPEAALLKNMTDDAAMARFCRDTLETVWHYHGGCEVGYVVNDTYQVNGVDSLRIVDSSTFTDSPGTNPQATVMMLGRYVGIKILRERAEMKQASLSALAEAVYWH